MQEAESEKGKKGRFSLSFSKKYKRERGCHVIVLSGTTQVARSAVREQVGEEPLCLLGTRNTGPAVPPHGSLDSSQQRRSDCLQEELLIH